MYIVVYYCNWPQPTTNEQSALKIEKAFSGIPTQVCDCLPGLALLPVSPLGSCMPKRLGPQVEVIQLLSET